jgi:phosphatidylglycerol lysyltransferase
MSEVAPLTPLARMKKLAPLVSLLLVLAAGFIIHHELRAYHWHDIQHALADLSPRTLALMLAATAAGYAVLTFYDWLGLEYGGAKLPYPRVALVSFLSYALSNTIGYAPVSGGSMRLRMYTAWGVSAPAVGKVILFCAFTYFIGALLLLLAGYGLSLKVAGFALPLPDRVLPLVVAVAVLALLGWAALVCFVRGEVTLRGVPFALPRPWLALRQALAAVADLLLASLVLYLPLMEATGMSYPAFLLLYIAAQMVGLFSQVPGGMGVFEGSFLFLTAGQYPATQILAALIAYRILYYFVPLVLAGLLLVAYELRAMLRTVPAHALSLLRVMEPAVPQVLGVLMLLGGAVLLFSSVTPAIAERMDVLKYFLPLPLIEFSHLVSSLMGVLLLFLARAVQQRMDSAYFASILALTVGIVASLAKGVDYEEAALLSLLLLILLPSRASFYRRSALLSLSLPPSWVGAAGTIIALAVWIGFFSYKHVEYSRQLWWDFSASADASRFLRTLLGGGVFIIALLLYRLLTLSRQDATTPPDAATLEAIAPLVHAAPETMPHLAMVGDKFILRSKSGQSFLMYDTTPHFWIALGDPVGLESEFPALVWRFREEADRHKARVAFYQVSTRHLPLYLDLGLILLKLGEEARVPLAGFGLEGKKRQSLRYAFNKHEKEGLSFAILPAAEVPPLLPELSRISNAWLDEKRVREKRFSLGYFDEAYLRRGPIAVVRQGETLLAFANLWETDSREELSIDLMRYDPAAPGGVMEYLTIALMLWGKAQGYRYFNLGMAPLSGLERHPLAPLWHKLGNRLYRHGGEFYNFEGLYNYKSKFAPEWQPRYLAAPAGLKVASTLLAVTSLISGGLKGALSK